MGMPRGGAHLGEEQGGDKKPPGRQLQQAHFALRAKTGCPEISSEDLILVDGIQAEIAGELLLRGQRTISLAGEGAGDQGDLLGGADQRANQLADDQVRGVRGGFGMFGI